MPAGSISGGGIVCERPHIRYSDKYNSRDILIELFRVSRLARADLFSLAHVTTYLFISKFPIVISNFYIVNSLSALVLFPEELSWYFHSNAMILRATIRSTITWNWFAYSWISIFFTAYIFSFASLLCSFILHFPSFTAW